MSIKNAKKEIEDLFETLISQSGSDLHLSSGRQPFIRVDGELIPLADREIYERVDTLNILSELVTKEKIDKLLKTV